MITLSFSLSVFCSVKSFPPFLVLLKFCLRSILTLHSPNRVAWLSIRIHRIYEQPHSFESLQCEVTEFHCAYNLSSANTFLLDRFEILLFGDDLKQSCKQDKYKTSHVNVTYLKFLFKGVD